jgi:LPXTG-site transpeptidase (sortase) family protein
MRRSADGLGGRVARQRTVAPLVATLLVIGVFASVVGIGRALGIPLPSLPWGWHLSDSSGMRPSTPKRLSISTIGVRADVVQVGRTEDGSIAPPAEDPVHAVGWYNLGPTPGEPGVAVMLGHVDTHDQAAVFQRLHELKQGDRVEVKREDRRVATFVVDSVEKFPKTSFPADRILLHDEVPRLVLVTCGGPFLGGDTGYADNVIAFAHLV